MTLKDKMAVVVMVRVTAICAHYFSALAVFNEKNRKLPVREPSLQPHDALTTP